LVLESPELLEDLKNNFGTKSLTVKTELDLLVDFKKSCLTVNDKDYQISPVGAAAQELIITKGLENWVKENID